MVIGVVGLIDWVLFRVVCLLDNVVSCFFGVSLVGVIVGFLVCFLDMGVFRWMVFVVVVLGDGSKVRVNIKVREYIVMVIKCSWG